ncbi:4-(cytidine 5'-diphospho)-2-C-methyl-D-erythritol kinase [Paraglaciecola aquimarina]|uniref:4-diphosphocytidyl-2-C-methyl-D-erythritol kinase n=1 Tax=Paraglaciecola aquimarina TaxID=1235557 RepID=A0ABU3SZW8_9ALTE|nr:4-(cytidine 5'-diphospho)-2-C-methyl-D-erythritol kinase [Paraglaciecola aquimarina]MDU0355554.1 4-(cytidine 5'-diphospho)-2-C-methyl-D-erythritol kinase [Paraglaciecola aquimarina]
MVINASLHPIKNQASPSTGLTWWPSPAKLNLFLHINGRYQNGYHQLQSLFQLLDFGDKIAFEVNASGHITLAQSIPGVADQDNLIVKAAKLLQNHVLPEKAKNLGCHIHLNKVLPMGGGIGGGSSNAATTLVALNSLWKLNLPDETLAGIGLQLGADVPIFIFGKTAFAEGVGEQLQAVELPQKYYLVVFPDCHVSTAEIFQLADLPRNTARIEFSDYKFDNTHNDCQEIVCERYPNVANTLQWLLEYAPSRMTGTGACVFAIFEQQQDALNVQAKLPKGSTSFVAQGRNISPLYAEKQPNT